MTMSAERSVTRALVITGLCGLPLLSLALLAGRGSLHGIIVHAPSVDDTPAAALGVGEVEMGRDFGRPAVPLERGALATVLLYGVLLLCPAKFVLLWVLQRRESRHMGAPAGAPPSGDA